MQFYLGFVYQSLRAILKYEGCQELSKKNPKWEIAGFMVQAHSVRENNPKLAPFKKIKTDLQYWDHLWTTPSLTFTFQTIYLIFFVKTSSIIIDSSLIRFSSCCQSSISICASRSTWHLFLSSRFVLLN